MKNRENVKIVRNAGVFTYVFGYIPLIVGAICLYIVYQKWSNAQPIEAAGSLAALGAFFTTAGLILALGRRGVHIRKNQGIVVCWWGLLIPFKQTDHALEEFDTIALTTEIKDPNSVLGEAIMHKLISYTIYLAGPTKAIKLGSFSNQKDAVLLARQINEITCYKVSSDLGLVEFGYPEQQARGSTSTPILAKGFAKIKGLEIQNQDNKISARFPLVIEKRWITGNLLSLVLAIMVIIMILGIDYLQSSNGQYFVYPIVLFCMIHILFFLGIHRNRPFIVISDRNIELLEISLLGFRKRLGAIERNEIEKISEKRDQLFGVKGKFQSIYLWNGLTRTDLDKLYKALNTVTVHV